MTSKEITTLAVYLAMTIAIHFVLAPIPNVTATLLLLILYIKGNRLYKGFILLTCFVLIINLIFGFSIFTLIQLLSYYILLLYKYIKREIAGVVIVSLLSMWVYIPFSVVVYDIDLWTYVLADLPFTLIYVVNNTLLVLWLYKPLEKVIALKEIW